MAEAQIRKIDEIDKYEDPLSAQQIVDTLHKLHGWYQRLSSSKICQ